MIDLRLHDAGYLAVPFRAALDLAFRPQRMFAQLMHGRVIVAVNLVRQGQIGRHEYPCLAPEKLQQPRGFPYNEARIGSFAYRPVEQQATCRRIQLTEASGRTAMISLGPGPRNPERTGR